MRHLMSILVVVGMLLSSISPAFAQEVTIGGPFEGEAGALNGAGATLIPADLRFSIVNSPGEGAYPISTAAWLLVYRDMPDRAKGLAVTRMLWWATHDAQRFN